MPEGEKAALARTLKDIAARQDVDNEIRNRATWLLWALLGRPWRYASLYGGIDGRPA